MAQRTWHRGSLLTLVLLGATAALAAAPGGPVLVAESRSAAESRSIADYDLGYRDGYNNLPHRYKGSSSRRDYAEGYRVGQARRQATGSAPADDDYVRGYGDGLNGKDDRDRDSGYRAGYRAGRAKHEANADRNDGRDYARGYRDGYNRFRERAAVPSSNRAYAAGFRAGQADHTGLVAGAPGRPVPPIAPVSPPATADNLVGRPSATLERDMKSLGFIQLAQNKIGRESFTTWQSRSLNRCLRLVTRAGKVQQVTDVDNANCT